MPVLITCDVYHPAAACCHQHSYHPRRARLAHDLKLCGGDTMHDVQYERVSCVFHRAYLLVAADRYFSSVQEQQRVSLAKLARAYGLTDGAHLSRSGNNLSELSFEGPAMLTSGCTGLAEGLQLLLRVHESLPEQVRSQLGQPHYRRRITTVVVVVVAAVFTAFARSARVCSSL